MVAALVAGGCGDDDEDTASATAPEETTTTAPDDTTTTEADGTAIMVTLAEDGYDGLPSEVPAGAITVEVTNDAGGATAVDFIHVADDLTEEQLRETMSGVLAGGPIPEELLGVSGVGFLGAGDTLSSTFLVEEGRHFVVASPEEGTDGADDEPVEGEEPEGEGEEPEGPAPASLIVQELTVVASGGAELPETDGTFTASDYDFEVDAQAGDRTFTARNDGPNQFRHVVLVGFGDADAATVEAVLPEFLASDEDAPPPEGIDPEAINFDLGESNVFSPGLGGTFEAAAPLEVGQTYAAMCFIQDRVGGPPHAVAYDMFEVFTVE